MNKGLEENSQEEKTIGGKCDYIYSRRETTKWLSRIKGKWT
jgi:hypothetical protein